MKHIILFFFLVICLSSFSQKNIPTQLPCTDEMAQNAKGRWIKTDDLGSYNLKEIYSRLEEVHKMFLKIYPEPTGVDATWSRGDGVSYFGSKWKYYNTPDGRLTFDYSNLPHFVKYNYASLFYRYKCEYSKTHSLLPGYPGVTNGSFAITANGPISNNPPAPDDNWTINGLPVYMRESPTEKKDGYEYLYRGSKWSSGEILIHRKGILPYTHVTRKQYLDYCITYHTKLHDESIKGFELLLATSKEADKKWINEKLSKAKEYKDEVLKIFTNAFEESKQNSLLDSPARIVVKYHLDPVFETDPSKGWMLITENPDYIRKDLPKHVPQFFVVHWSFYDWPSFKKIGEIINGYFPFEKLEAMIDK